MPSKRTSKDYENLGRLVANIHDSGYLDHKQTYKMSFLKGIAGGLGGVVGATIVVALLLWILSAFKEVPLVGPLIRNTQNTVDSVR